MCQIPAGCASAPVWCTRRRWCASCRGGHPLVGATGERSQRRPCRFVPCRWPNRIPSPGPFVSMMSFTPNGIPLRAPVPVGVCGSTWTHALMSPSSDRMRSTARLQRGLPRVPGRSQPLAEGLEPASSGPRPSPPVRDWQEGMSAGRSACRRLRPLESSDLSSFRCPGVDSVCEPARPPSVTARPRSARRSEAPWNPWASSTS